MSYCKTTLAELLKTIVANTKLGFHELEGLGSVHVVGGEGSSVSIAPTGSPLPPPVPLSTPSGPTISILPEGVRASEEFIREVLEDREFGECLSSEAIMDLLDRIAQRFVSNSLPNDVEALVRSDILKPLRKSIRPWRCFVPLYNLQTAIELDFGSAVMISRDTGMAAFDDFQSNHLYGGSQDNQEQQRQFTAETFQQAFAHVDSFVRIDIRSNEKNVWGRAVAGASGPINALRAFTGTFYRRELRAFFGTAAETARGPMAVWANGLDEDEGATMRIHNIGPLHSFDFDEQKLKWLRSKCGFEELQEIFRLDEPSRSPLDSAIIQATHALGSATIESAPDQMLVRTVSSIERVIIPDGVEATTERFADRLALLLGRSAENKRVIRTKAKRIYDVRSKIVHAAAVNVDDDDLDTIQHYARSTLVSVLAKRSKFNGFGAQAHRRFCDSVDDMKFG